MHVLLAGEFSGLHNHLKRGLAHHGVEATTLNTNDAWKQFPSDILLRSSAPWPFQILSDELGLKLLSYANRSERFDAVQLINPIIANSIKLQLVLNTLRPHKRAILKLLEHSPKSFLLGAGDDKYYFAACRNSAFEYNPLPTALKYDMPLWKRIYSQSWTRNVLCEWNVQLANRVSGIIPCAYEYAVAYSQSGLGNVRPLIRFPFFLDNIAIPQRKRVGPVRVLHTPTRSGFKGSALILEAFELLKSHHKRVDLIVGHPQNIRNYGDVLQSVDVVVDQVYSYSYAMNALYSLAHGRVVLTGFEPAARELLRVSDCDAILNLKPEVQQIAETIMTAVERVESDRELPEKARHFVEEFHCAKRIAKEYISAWTS